MSENFINFVDWIVILILVLSLLRIAGTIHNIYEASPELIKLAEIKYMQGKIKEDPFNYTKEFTFAIVSSLWLYFM